MGAAMTGAQFRAVETFRGVVYPWHCDGMGHMNTQFYAALYDGASFHFLALLCPSAELKLSGFGWADVRQTIEYKHETTLGDLLVVRSTLARLGSKSVEYRHELVNLETDVVHGTSQQVTVLFDLATRKAVPLGDGIRRRAAAMEAPASGSDEWCDEGGGTPGADLRRIAETREIKEPTCD